MVGTNRAVSGKRATTSPRSRGKYAAPRFCHDGVWLIVEPFANGAVAENLNPVGRIYYSFSTFLCVPHAVSEGADDLLGAQAGEQAIAGLVRAVGFGTFRRAAETPFHLVYEARP